MKLPEKVRDSTQYTISRVDYCYGVFLACALYVLSKSRVAVLVERFYHNRLYEQRFLRPTVRGALKRRCVAARDRFTALSPHLNERDRRSLPPRKPLPRAMVGLQPCQQQSPSRSARSDPA